MTDNFWETKDKDNPYLRPEERVKTETVCEEPLSAPYEALAQKQSVSAATKPVKSGRFDFSAFEKVFALIVLVLGYVFIRFLFGGTAPGLGALAFFELALGAGIAFLAKEGVKFNGTSISCAVFIACFPVTFILSDNATVKGIGALFLVVFYMYWIYSACTEIRGCRQRFLRDMARSTFVNPFKNFIALPLALFKPAKNAKTKVLRYVVLGLLVTIPFTAVIGALLLSSDEAFRNFIGIDSFKEELGEFFVRFIFAVPVAMLLFSVMISSVRDKEAIKKMKGRNHKGFANHIVFVTAFVPVILLYIAFFISQFAYFTSAFKSILPEDFTYAQYARQGFFELCTVVAVNVLMVLLTMLLCKKKENGHYCAGVKLVVCVLCLFSVALVAISVAKMVMYTSAYGLTHKRIYTLWLAAFMFFLVLILFLKILAPKYKFWSATFAVFMMLFFVFSFFPTDAVIAKYNVQWYKEGKIGWMGEEALYELNHSAVPYLDELFEDDTKAVNEIDPEWQYYYKTWYEVDGKEYYDDYYETVGEQIQEFYSYLASFDNGFVGFNLPENDAQVLFEKREIKPFTEEPYSEGIYV